MKISDAKKVIKEIYKTGSVTALISERGVGKTSAYKQCAQELGIGYKDIYAAALEGPDFMGLPDKNRGKGVTEYLAPEFMPTVEAVDQGLFNEKGILVIEEINRVPSDTVSILYPLLLDRQFNGHTLAKGWRIGVTMNPDSMNYMVNSLDDAIIDRFVSIQIDADLENYIEYSMGNNPNESVLNYLKTYPEMLLITKKNSTVMDKSPTPRGWSKVQEILNTCTLDEELLIEIIAGIVGVEAAASYIGFTKLNNNLLPDSRELLRDYRAVEDSVARLINNNRFDILSALISSLISNIDDKNIAAMDQLNLFLNDIPKDLQMLFFKELAGKRVEISSEISVKMDSFEQISDEIIDMTVS